MGVQVKSRQRVADHGEVFTADREVNAMLDLVKQETERVDSRFLEPACGDGNFVAEILRRKLEAAKKRAIPPKKKKPLPMEFEKQSVIAVASIYGVDLMIMTMANELQNKTNATEESFWSMLSNTGNECSIYIPRIQRDYAQGRTDDATTQIRDQG